ncbi:hypothetical protein [Azospirillum ramasamyi]|uniref:J domain-containing protein n=1 Tax=Azospirillum ramasamyi TaxID=682998 RepID=A0A2U9SFA6_9PROT|nr:hypothetical protein [Azospirillum ramasamyi]AWU98074.1 hypothetical protein DM194_27690 [Azospirillum ramasamyi]
MANLLSFERTNINLVDDGLLCAFYDLKAELAYFCSIPTVRPRRDRHADTLAVLDRWFAFEPKRRLETITDLAIGRNGAVKAPLLGSSLLLASEWARCAEFFSADDFQSTEALRAAYRRAAKACHPDGGGSHEEMIALNDTFALLYEAVSSEWVQRELQAADRRGRERDMGPFGIDLSVIKPTKAKPFRAAALLDEAIAKLWLEILVDEWNLDAAVRMVGGFARFPLLLTPRASPLPMERWGLLSIVQKLVERCHALNRPDLCADIVPRLAAEIANSEMDYYNGRLKETLSGVKRAPVLNHPRQRSNAERLSSRPLPAVRTRSGKTALTEAANAPVTASTEIVSFTALPFDPPPGARPPDPSRIPFPRAYGPPSESYTPAQSWEYHQAFYGSGGRDLIDKHKWARAWSIMLTLVTSDVPPAPVLVQLKRLGDMFPDHMAHLAQIGEFLQRMEPGQLRERLSLLRKLDAAVRRGSFPGWDPIRYANGTECLVVGVGSGYVDVVRADPERLKLAIRTGSLLTAEENRRRSGAWTRMHRFLDDQRRKGADAFEEMNRGDDEAVVRIKSAYIDACLALAPEVMEVAGGFQICWSYDRMTAALVRLGCWTEARARLRQLFALPECFFERCSPSDRQTLRKRLDRLERQLDP